MELEQWLFLAGMQRVVDISAPTTSLPDLSTPVCRLHPQRYSSPAFLTECWETHFISINEACLALLQGRRGMAQLKVSPAPQSCSMEGICCQNQVLIALGFPCC